MFLAAPSLIATPHQLQLLAKPWTSSLNTLKAADFLGRQDYIDWWIKHWLVNNDDLPLPLPLCVEESIHCNSKLRKKKSGVESNLRQISDKSQILIEIKSQILIGISNFDWNLKF